MNVSLFSHSMGLTSSDLGKTIGGKAINPLDQKITVIAAAIMLVIAASALLLTMWHWIKPRTPQEKASNLCTEGLLLQVRGENEKAKLKYEEALKENPKDIDALVGCGETFNKIGEKLTQEGKAEEAAISFTEAEKKYKTALEYDSRNTKALEFYGRFLKKQGRNEEATIQFTNVEEQYKKQLEDNPKDVDALENYGLFLQKQDKKTEAAQMFRKLAHIAPTATNLFSYASALWSIENYAEAATQYKKCFEIEPNNIFNLQAYIRSLFIQADFAEAEKLCKKGFELFPKDTSFWVAYGNILCKQGRFDEAEAELKKRLRTHPNELLENYNKLIMMREYWRGQSLPNQEAVEIEPNMTMVLFSRLCLHP